MTLTSEQQRCRPQVDEELIALIEGLIEDALFACPDLATPRQEAEAVARALLAAGWRKETDE